MKKNEKKYGITQFAVDNRLVTAAAIVAGVVAVTGACFAAGLICRKQSKKKI